MSAFRAGASYISMANDHLYNIKPLNPAASRPEPTPSAPARSREGDWKICGIDVGSTTCKYTLATKSGEVLAQTYERHNTKQAEKVLQFLTTLEKEHGLTPQRDCVFFTGSGSGGFAPLAG